MEKNRLDNFSDGVFAFAVTLLIFNIRIPDTQHLDNRHLNAILYGGIPHLVTFGFTFLVVGVFWVAHQRIFRFIKVVDFTLVWLNIFYLLFVAMIPLPAAILSGNPFLPSAILFYTATLFLVASMHFVLLEYIYRRKDLKQEEMTRDVFRNSQRISVVGPVGYVLAAATSFLNIYISFAFILAVLIFYIFFSGRTKAEEKLVEIKRKQVEEED
jgi:uncharacterized membrane protein